MPTEEFIILRLWQRDNRAAKKIILNRAGFCELKHQLSGWNCIDLVTSLHGVGLWLQWKD